MRELARVHGQLGDLKEASRLLHESLQLKVGDEVGIAPLLRAAKICTQINLLDHARGYLLDALQSSDSERSPLDRLRILMLIAIVHQNCSEWDEARRRLQQAIDMAARIGDRSNRIDLLIDLARVHRIVGDVENARKKLEEAIHLSRVIGWWEGIKRAETESEMLRYAAPQAL